MPGRQARIIAPVQLDALLQHVRGRKDVLRCRVIILLSLRAGLRAGEIAKLEWSMISDPNGKIAERTKRARVPAVGVCKFAKRYLLARAVDGIIEHRRKIAGDRGAFSFGEAPAHQAEHR